MKLVSYKNEGAGPEGILGLVVDSGILNMIDTAQRYLAVAHADGEVPVDALHTMKTYLEGGEAVAVFAKKVNEWAKHHPDDIAPLSADDIVIIAPVPRPTSMRDGYAFRQHVETARRNRGVEMIPEFDEFPVFYFTNHNAVTGPGDVEVMEQHLNRLDFELECAIVIGKEGKNLKASDVDEYIAGYAIMNDWSARALQMQEMKLNLGPAKGKDFATSIGPWLVTRDELAPRRIAGENGEAYDLTMVCRVNGIEVSRGNVKDMTWTFGQILERASYGVTLHPGDVIGSGTVGTGCFLELNGSGITDNQWLQDGDVVEMEIEMLGHLTNTVKKVG